MSETIYGPWLWTVIRGPYLDVARLSEEEFVVLMLATLSDEPLPRPSLVWTTEVDVMVPKALRTWEDPT